MVAAHARPTGTAGDGQPAAVDGASRGSRPGSPAVEEPTAEVADGKPWTLAVGRTGPTSVRGTSARDRPSDDVRPVALLSPIDGLRVSVGVSGEWFSRSPAIQTPSTACGWCRRRLTARTPAEAISPIRSLQRTLLL